MKTILLFLTFTIISFNSFSQLEYNYYNLFTDNSYSFIPKKTIIDKSIHKVTITRKTKKGKVKSIKSFDDNGNLTNYIHINKKGDTTLLIDLKYNNDNKVTAYKQYKKGKLKVSEYFDYNENGKPIAKYFQKSNHDRILKASWKYNNDNCQIESKSYNNKGKLQYVWKYEYYTKCEKSKSIVYNRKGKVLNIWNYTCKDEGELFDKNKKENKVCKWDSITNNYLYKVTETFNNKGYVTRSIKKYSLDTLILERSYYNKDNILYYDVKYDKDYSKPLYAVSYKRNGKTRYRWEYKYNDNKQVYRSFTRRNKLQFINETKYDKDLLTEVKTLNSKGELKSISSIDYKMY